MLHSLTSLRFFCALYVFLFHVEIRHPFTPSWLKPIIDDGYAGMSFFFVLSGFVLAVRFQEETLSWRDFAVARFGRIYPAFAVAFLFSLYSLTPLSSLAFVTNASLNALLLQAWFPNVFGIGLNGGTWSLSVEFFFYALFPYLLILFRKVDSSRILILSMALAWLLSFLPGIVENSFNTPGSMLFYYSSPPYRLAEFMLGIAAATAWKKGYLRVGLIQLFMVSVIYVGSTYFIRGMAGSNLSMLNLTSVPAVSGLILYAAQHRPAFLENPVLIFLGSISYGFYVYQFLFFQALMPRLEAYSLSSSVIVLTGLITTNLIAFLSFKFFEIPFKCFLIKQLCSAKINRKDAAVARF